MSARRVFWRKILATTRKRVGDCDEHVRVRVLAASKLQNRACSGVHHEEKRAFIYGTAGRCPLLPTCSASRPDALSFPSLVGARQIASRRKRKKSENAHPRIDHEKIEKSPVTEASSRR